MLFTTFNQDRLLRQTVRTHAMHLAAYVHHVLRSSHAEYIYDGAKIERTWAFVTAKNTIYNLPKTLF